MSPKKQQREISNYSLIHKYFIYKALVDYSRFYKNYRKNSKFSNKHTRFFVKNIVVLIFENSTIW